MPCCVWLAGLLAWPRYDMTYHAALDDGGDNGCVLVCLFSGVFGGLLAAVCHCRLG